MIEAIPKKSVLFLAIILHIFSLFLTILTYRNYHTSEIDSYVTGFSVVGDVKESAPLPIIGIISIVWIVLNLYITRKSFKSNAIYIIMSIFNLAGLIAYLFFIFGFLGEKDHCANGMPRYELHSGFYVFLTSLCLYIISYIFIIVFNIASNNTKKQGIL